MLMVVDPYNHQQITFSQCVALFSSVTALVLMKSSINFFLLKEMIVDGDNSLSILQKLSLEA